MKNPFVISFCLICGLITFVSVQKMQESLTLIEESDQYLIDAEKILKYTHLHSVNEIEKAYHFAGKRDKDTKLMKELYAFRDKSEALEKRIDMTIKRIRLIQKEQPSEFRLFDFWNSKEETAIRIEAQKLYPFYQEFYTLMYQHSQKYDMYEIKIQTEAISEEDFIDKYFAGQASGLIIHHLFLLKFNVMSDAEVYFKRIASFIFTSVSLFPKVTKYFYE